MRVRCENCDLDMDVPRSSEGRMLECPECGARFVCKVPRAIVVDGEEPARPGGELLLEEELPEEVVELSEELEQDDRPPADPLEQVVEAKLSRDEALVELGKDQPRQIIKESPRQWYVVVGGVAAVALTFDELKRKAAIGVVKPKARLFYAPQELNVQARDVPGLFPEEDEKRAKSVKPKRRRKLSADAVGAVGALSELGETEGSAAEAGAGGETADEQTGLDAAEVLGELGRESERPEGSPGEDEAGRAEAAAAEALGQLGAGDDRPAGEGGTAGPGGDDAAKRAEAAAAEALGQLGTDEEEPPPTGEPSKDA